MNVALLINPIAGRGRAPQFVAQFESRLQRVGFTIERFESQPESPEALAPFDTAVVVGGDGTMNRWLPVLSASGVSVWHVPMGTENLFARYFRHGPSAERFIRAARSRQATTVDLGRCGGRLFAIMLSLGPDADVVQAVAEQRAGPIRRMSYARPVLGRLRRGLTTRGTVTTGDQIMVDGPIGMLIAANLPSYAVGLNPAWHAQPSDGVLTVVHLPGRGSFGIGARLAAGLTRTHALVPGRDAREAARIEIRCHQAADMPPSVQIDGDLLDQAAWDGDRLLIESVPKALRVLRAST